jgi:hypothetical protein
VAAQSLSDVAVAAGRIPDSFPSFNRVDRLECLEMFRDPEMTLGDCFLFSSPQPAVAHTGGNVHDVVHLDSPHGFAALRP